jgi:hypothetical protein
MTTALWAGRILLAAVCVVVFAMPGTLRAQSAAMSITLTGQSMIRTDIRAHAPAPRRSSKRCSRAT